MDEKKVLELHNQMIEDKIIPTELYKHMTISNNLYKTLINAELWFATPISFNDPFDCQINDQTNWSNDNILDYVTKTANANGEQIDPNDVVRKNQEHPGSFNKYFTDVFKKLISDQGVACFLPNYDNLLLWAHYSSAHTGVCLKFDINNDKDLFALTFPVKYSKDYPQFDYLVEKEELVNKVILTKSQHWEYENEIRVLKTKFGNYPFKKECLKEIIFGCKSNPNEIKTIRQIVLNANYPDLKLRKLVLKDNKYEVEIVDI